ncbi:MAG: hypothetical protein ACYC9O_16625 [Candidatus Latescibacterota bacterium]
MHGKILKITALLLLAGSLAASGFAQGEQGIKVTIDREARRLDLKTGKTVPEHRLARPGSIRFHLGRLDRQDDFIYYLFDNLRTARITDLAHMEKDQPEHAIWNLVWKNGQGLHPQIGVRIQHLAASYEPILSDGKPGGRIYLPLTDLKRIEWEPKER